MPRLRFTVGGSQQQWEAFTRGFETDLVGEDTDGSLVVLRLWDCVEAEELYQKRVLTITGICVALLVVGIVCVVAYCKTK